MRYWYVLQRKGKCLLPAALAFREFVLKQAGSFAYEISFAGPVICKNCGSGAVQWLTGFLSV
jgi:hypothetical protein